MEWGWGWSKMIIIQAVQWWKRPNHRRSQNALIVRNLAFSEKGLDNSVSNSMNKNVSFFCSGKHWFTWLFKSSIRKQHVWAVVMQNTPIVQRDYNPEFRPEFGRDLGVNAKKAWLNPIDKHVKTRLRCKKRTFRRETAIRFKKQLLL